MAVTTTYSIGFVKDLNLDLTDNGKGGEPEVIALANGGFAVAGDHATGGAHIDGDIFNSSGNRAGDWNNGDDINGSNASLAQLKNGNIVQFSEDGAGHLFFEIRNTSGGSVKASTEVFNSTYAPDVTATANGFWTASEVHILNSNNDIYIDRWNNAGAYQGNIVVDNSNADDGGTSIAALTGGNVAVAWTRFLGNGDSEIHYAVYNSSGGVVRASSTLDNIGGVNRNVSMTALANGGFAVAYEDDGFGYGSVDITVGIYNASGVLQIEANITDPGGVDDNSDDAHPYITQLANGLLVVAYSDNLLSDTDTNVVLLDSNLDILAEHFISTLGANRDAELPAVAGFGNGQIAVLEDSGGTNAGEALQVARNSNGDSGNNVITGDFLVDSMNGAGGADTLNGAGGNDTLRGSLGADKLNGGDGNDVLIGGPGHDTLTGGVGGDRFVFNATPAAAYSDTITDFTPGRDRIQFDDANFTQIGPKGTLSAQAFFAGANAHDTSDRILYDSATGKLFYDPDGTGGAAKVLVAVLDDGLTLHNTDFVVI